MPELRAPHIADVALTSYLTGQQDGQQWALIDNLDADEAREVAELAITMLREANACIALASLALDPMEKRSMRFKAHDAANALIEPYLTALAERFNGGHSASEVQSPNTAPASDTIGAQASSESTVHAGDCADAQNESSGL